MAQITFTVHHTITLEHEAGEEATRAELEQELRSFFEGLDLGGLAVETDAGLAVYETVECDTVID